MSGFVTYTAPTRSVKPRKGEHGVDFDRGAMLLYSIGSETLDQYVGGTPVGIVTATNQLRPCGKGVINGAQIGVTTIQMDAANADNFYVGDVVQFIDAATGAIIATKTLTVVDKTLHRLTFAGAITVADDDYVILDSATAAVAGADHCVGILSENVVLVVPGAVPIARRQREGVYIVHGRVSTSLCPSVNALIQADLPLISFE